jgi:hypothetical protein
MAALTNPINAQNIVDRFSDYVVATANQGIVWGLNNVPTGDTSPAVVDPIVQIVPTDQFGGTTAGLPINIDGNSIKGPDDAITATTIYNTLLAETNRYTRIRNLNAVLRVVGTGGNAGTRLRNSGYDPGRAYIEVTNATNPANMIESYEYPVSIQPASSYGIVVGGQINGNGLETFFDALRLAYLNSRAVAIPYITSVCHASCHSSCHNSRGRR